MTDERVVYEINEVVWAKIRGYPWWPAYVSGVIKSSSQPGQVEYIVNFYGDTSQYPVDNRIDSARLAPDKVAKFQPNYAEFEQKARSSKKLAKSVLIAEEALKSQGFNYVLEKRPARRPSKAHSKLSSDMQSFDHMESELGDSQNRSASKGFKPSPEKKEAASVRDEPKVKVQPMLIEAVPVPSPAKKQSTPKLTPIKEQPKQVVAPLALPIIKESKGDKHPDKDAKDVPDRPRKGNTKEPKQTKEQKQSKQAKEVKEVPKEVKEEPFAAKTSLSEDDEEQEEPPLKKQSRSSQPNRKSRPKVKRSASKPGEKKDEEKKPRKEEPPPAPIIPEPVNELLVTVEKVKSLLANPQQLINYLATIEITVKNVKEILDCQIVDILHETKNPTAKELLKKMKATLIARYFDDDTVEKVRAKRSVTPPVRSESKKDDIRSKTRHKAQLILRKHYSLNEQHSSAIALQLETALHTKDPTSGSTYKKLALQTLSHLKNRTLTVQETLKRITTNSLAKG